MTSRIAVTAIDAVQPQVVADFWCAVLGWDVVERDEGVISIGPVEGSLRSEHGAGGAGPTIDVVPVPEAKSSKNRLHFDLRADGSTTADELARLLELGARRVEVGQAPDVSWTVLADPEGNEFCLLLRSVQDVEREPPMT